MWRGGSGCGIISRRGRDDAITDEEVKSMLVQSQHTMLYARIQFYAGKIRLRQCTFILGFKKNKIIDNAHNTHYDIIK